MAKLNERQIERYENDNKSYERFDKKKRNDYKPSKKEKHKWKRDLNQ